MRLDGIPLWDGTEYRGPVDLAWEPDRITDLSPAAQRHGDLCVLPGLVDTHVHLVGYAGAGEPPDFATWPLTQSVDLLWRAWAGCPADTCGRRAVDHQRAVVP
ncbi:hypothetical protein AB0J43_20900, partial [Nonomuraea fuscirosea]